ncbi:MAG: type 4a pilus biogenesis protein PilO [Planctomycetota bacterium]|jgi:Tfp pilus assembly protein PilO|nr:type 4a pilus biogenesis protein PilO [Planctomycetota bacterium]
MLANKNMQIFLAAAALLFLGCGYYLWTQLVAAGDSWPYENEPGSLTAANNALQNEVRRLQEDAKKIPAANESLKTVKADYDLATLVLPRENTPDQLVAAIRTKAEQAGVVLIKLVPSRVGATQGAGARAPQRGRGAQAAAFEEWNFSLNIRGTYDQIASFVNHMEEFESSDPNVAGSEKRFFQVRDIDITADQGGLGFFGVAGAGPSTSPRQRHECSLVMQTYRYTGAN